MNAYGCPTETVAAAVGYTGRLEFDATKPDGTPRKLMNVDRLNAKGRTASTAFKSGLSQVYRDFIERYPRATPLQRGPN